MCTKFWACHAKASRGPPAPESQSAALHLPRKSDVHQVLRLPRQSSAMCTKCCAWRHPGRVSPEMLFFPPKIPIRCNLFSSNRKGKSLLVLMSNRLGKTTFPFHIEPFAPCLEAVWFSDACVRPRLLRLPAKPSSSGVSTTCLSSCFPFPFCSCTRRLRVKTVNRNYCISSNRY